MFTANQIAKYCLDVYAAKWVYWYGTYGKKCTKSLYESKRKQYPSHYGSDRTAGYMKDIAEGKTCADCVGMIKSFFWKGGDLNAEPKYKSNNCPDVSANGMIKLCPQTGPISTIPDVPGLVVWKDGHIGVYVGGGYTVEMKGFNYDCKKKKVKDGPWKKWGRLPKSMISYTDEPTPDTEPVGDRDLKNGDRGPDVQQMQEDLISLGYSCGKWGADGIFGDATEMAVEAFQGDHGLPVTGVYDGATREAMEAALDGQDIDPPDEPKTVLIVGGDCYVRTAPNTGGKKLGVAHEGDRLPYGGETSDNGWNMVEYKGQNGWVSGKYSRLIDSGGTVTRGAKIVDISHHKTVANYDALIEDTALIILRPGVRKKDGKIYKDDAFDEQSAELLKRGVRFGTFFYSMAATEEQAREEARAYVQYADDTNPLWWSIDAERPEITAEAIAAFVDEMRKLGAVKVGAYVANEKYKTPYRFDSIRDLFDFTWIPNYIERPKYPCDLWQYTSKGRVAGINDDVDLNRITGEGHDLSWFTGG